MATNQPATDVPVGAEEPLNYRHLPDAFYLICFSLGITSCVLSLFGSTSIAYIIARNKKWKGSLYHRIILGMSLTDILSSVGILGQPFLVPQVTNLPFAIGNFASCEAVAFLTFFLYASYMYKGQLSLYFLFSICYNWQVERLVKVFEPWVHIFNWVTVSLLAGLALHFEALNPNAVTGVCFYEAYPADCHKDPVLDCQRGSFGPFVGFLFMFTTAAAFLSAIVGIGATWRVYAGFRAQQRRNERYLFRGSSTNNTTTHAADKFQKAVVMQAIWFTAAFLNSFLINVVGTITGNWLTRSASSIRSLEGEPLAKLNVFLVYVFIPLQGFFNWIVYIRPDLIRWKQNSEEETWWSAYRHVLNSDPIPSTGLRRNHTSRRRSILTEENARDSTTARAVDNDDITSTQQDVDRADDPDS